MNAKFCNLCGEPITGQGKLVHHANWSTTQNLRVCQNCYDANPRCSNCNLPLAVTEIHALCPTCSQNTQRCRTCGKWIKGRYWEINGIGPFCDQCHAERPPCDVCGAPLSEERWMLSDGRVFCGHCHATGVFRQEEARALYEESKKVIYEAMGLELNIPTALALVDRDQLTEVIRKQSNGINDFDIEKTLGIYARKGMKRGIYLQSGLPRLLFLQVASHEYAHAWQGENCPLLRDNRLREGFAEWVAYRVLGYYGYKDQMVRMRSKNDFYSQGLQWVLDLESRVGMAGVIETCRQSR